MSQSAVTKRIAFVRQSGRPPVKRAKQSGDEAHERPPGCGPAGRSGGPEIFEHLLFEKRNLRYDARIGDIKPPQLGTTAGALAKEK